MGMTSIDCVGGFAPFLANVICCPQVEANLIILVGQSSKDTDMLALNGTLAKPCLSDFEQILVGQGANDSLNKICSIHPSNLTEGSCPVKDIDEFERIVDSSSLLAACEKIDAVTECCEQVCQNAIAEAAGKLVAKAYNLLGVDASRALSDHSSRISDCKTIALRWLASKLDPSQAKEVLRGLSNCKINKGESYNMSGFTNWFFASSNKDLPHYVYFYLVLYQQIKVLKYLYFATILAFDVKYMYL